VGGGTSFLDHPSYLTGVNDPAWYEANIPFVDLPDKTIQDVYYYRWRVWKEHLRYTNPTDGWISTEFLDCCGYAAPYQAINAAAGHQISEGRWVRDQNYLDDYTKFWLTGPGAGAKPATDGVNADTTDWAHEYSFWLASAAYGRAQVSGDFSQLEALLPELERQYHGWDKQYNAQLGLYWSVPVWDAMELSASSYQVQRPLPWRCRLPPHAELLSVWGCDGDQPYRGPRGRSEDRRPVRPTGNRAQGRHAEMAVGPEPQLLLRDGAGQQPRPQTARHSRGDRLHSVAVRRRAGR